MKLNQYIFIANSIHSNNTKLGINGPVGAKYAAEWPTVCKALSGYQYNLKIILPIWTKKQC